MNNEIKHLAIGMLPNIGALVSSVSTFVLRFRLLRIYFIFIFLSVSFLTHGFTEEFYEENLADTHSQLLAFDGSITNTQDWEAENLKKYEAKNADPVVKELKNSTGCIHKETKDDIVPIASASVMRSPNGKGYTVLTSAHIFLDEDSQYEDSDSGEIYPYFFSLNCSDKLLHRLNIEEYLLKKYQEMGLVGKYKKGEKQ